MAHNKDRRPEYPTEGNKHSSRKKKIKPIHIFWIVFFVILGAIVTYTELTIWQVKQDPVETTAVIYAESLSGGNGRNYFYKFDVEGVTYKGKCTKGEIGDVIKIRYNRKDPSKNYSAENGECI